MVVPSVRLSGVAIRCVVGAVPALVVVVFAGLIALLGLFVGDDRRQYVLDLMDRFIDLTGVLVGFRRTAPSVDEPASVLEVAGTSPQAVPDSAAA